MSRRYELARALATMETIPEIRGRLESAVERFDRLRGEGGFIEVDAPPGSPAANAIAVFGRHYESAVAAIGEAIDAGGTPAPNQLIALESLVRRTEQAVDAFERTIQQPGGGVTRAGMGAAGPLLVGVALIGVVWWLSREPEFDF
jgi:hypothetical protein